MTTGTRAPEIARSYAHSKVDLAHMLLAFLEPTDPGAKPPSGLPDEQLAQATRGIRKYLQSQPPSSGPPRKPVHVTERLRVALVAAKQDALASGQRAFCVRDVLLALVEEDFFSEIERCAGGSALGESLGVTPSQLRRILASAPSSHDGGAGGQFPRG